MLASPSGEQRQQHSPLALQQQHCAPALSHEWPPSGSGTSRESSHEQRLTAPMGGEDSAMAGAGDDKVTFQYVFIPADT